MSLPVTKEWTRNEIIKCLQHSNYKKINYQNDTQIISKSNSIQLEEQQVKSMSNSRQEFCSTENKVFSLKKL